MVKSLKEYELEAKRLIAKYALSGMKKRILSDYEHIGYIMTKLMEAEHSYDESKGASLGFYKTNAAIIAMLTITRRCKAKKAVKFLEEVNDKNVIHVFTSQHSKSTMNFDSEVVQKILNGVKLKPRQLAAVYLHFFEGRNYTEIGEIVKVSREAVRRWVDSAVQKMKQYADENHIEA